MPRSSSVATFAIVATAMNVSLRAEHYFTFSLTFRPLSEDDYRMARCGQVFESERRWLSNGTFRYPENERGGYGHCLRKSWIFSHRSEHSGKGYRVLIRRVALETCCDRLTIAGIGSGPVNTFTFPTPSYPYGYMSETTLFFTQSTLNVSLSTDSSVSGEGFEIELSPYTGPPVAPQMPFTRSPDPWLDPRPDLRPWGPGSGPCWARAPAIVTNVSVGTSAQLKYPENKNTHDNCERRMWLFTLQSQFAHLKSMVLVKSVHLESCCDFVTVGEYPESSALEHRFTGTAQTRHLETGDEGVALLLIESNSVNVTFVSTRRSRRSDLSCKCFLITHPDP